MRKGGAAGGLPRWGGYLIAPLVVWLIVIAALDGGVAWAQHRSEQQFQRRFDLRATIGADGVPEAAFGRCASERGTAHRAGRGSPS
jgi:hypothetical protein